MFGSVKVEITFSCCDMAHVLYHLPTSALMRLQRRRRSLDAEAAAASQPQGDLRLWRNWTPTGPSAAASRSWRSIPVRTWDRVWDRRGEVRKLVLKRHGKLERELFSK